MDPSGRDSRYNLNYGLTMMADSPDSIYGNPNVTLARPPSGGLGHIMSRGNTGGGSLLNNNNNNNNNNTSPGSMHCGGGGMNRGIKRTNSECYDDRSLGPGQTTLTGLDGVVSCGPNSGGGVMTDVIDDGYTSLGPHNPHQNHNSNNNNNVHHGGGGGVVSQAQPTTNNSNSKKSPPSNGKKTKGRVKIKMEYIDNKLRRYTTFSKRKTGIMKKAYELSTLTGTQVMLLVASETGHVYTFATRKLQPMITSEAGKALIQTCLNSPDPPSGPGSGDQRMSATGFEETELSYNIGDEDSKDGRSMSSGAESDDSSGPDSPGGPATINNHNISSSNNGYLMLESEATLLGLSNASAAGASKGGSRGPQLSNGGGPVGSNDKNTMAVTSLPPTVTAAGQMTNPMGTTLPVATTTAASGSIATSTATANVNSVLYPATALANLPPDVLLSLMQSGHLQLHTNEDGGHQYISIPLAVMTGAGLSIAGFNNKAKEEAMCVAAASSSTSSSSSASSPAAATTAVVTSMPVTVAGSRGSRSKLAGGGRREATPPNSMGIEMRIKKESGE